MNNKTRLAQVFAALAFVTAVPWAAAEYPMAGLKPDQRPEGAPVIAEVAKDAAWFERALRGVEKPYPESLKFLENQGNWYTPFNHPGMPGRYDIRKWHVTAK